MPDWGQTLATQTAAPALMGLCLGIAGFMPLFAAVRVTRAAAKPRITVGLAAIGISFAFLMAVEAATWALRPEWLLSVTAGMLVGFFASWALLASWASRHR